MNTDLWSIKELQDSLNKPTDNIDKLIHKQEEIHNMLIAQEKSRESREYFKKAEENACDINTYSQETNQLFYQFQDLDSERLKINNIKIGTPVKLIFIIPFLVAFLISFWMFGLLIKWNVLIYFLVFGFSILYGFSLHIFTLFYKNTTSSILQDNKMIQEKLWWSIDIHEIILLVDSIYLSSTKIMRREIIFKYFCHAIAYNIFINLRNSQILFILNVLKSIKENISLQIETQQVYLKETKSEVEKNLSWTPELLKVSEAQKLRLDRQIEQFEELQKRLVKIP